MLPRLRPTVPGLVRLVALAAGGVAALVILRDGLTPGAIWGVRDAYHFYAPLEDWIGRELAAGRPPLWCAEENFGTPIADEPSAGVFDPWRLVLTPWLPPDVRIKLRVVLHLAIAAVGAWRLFYRVVGRGPGPLGGWTEAAACLAGMAYALSGPVLFSYSNPIYLVGAAWLPWTLAAAVAIGRGGRATPGVLGLAIPLALTVLGGDPQGALHAALLAAPLAIVPGLCGIVRGRPRRTGSDRTAPERDAARPGFRPIRRDPLDLRQAVRTSLRRSLIFAAGVGLAGGLDAVQIGATLTSPAVTVQASEVRPRSLIEIAGRGLRRTLVPGDPGRNTGSLVEDLATLVTPPTPGTHAYDLWEFSFHPALTAEAVAPGVFGGLTSPNTRWSRVFDGGRIWTPTVFVGTLTAILVLAGLLGGSGGAGRYWRGATVVTLLFSFGNLTPVAGPASWTGLPTVPVASPYGLLIATIPGYGMFRYPAKWLIPASLAAAMLAGLTLRREGVRGVHNIGTANTRPTERRLSFLLAREFVPTFGPAGLVALGLFVPATLLIASLMGDSRRQASPRAAPEAVQGHWVARFEQSPASPILGPVDGRETFDRVMGGLLQVWGVSLAVAGLAVTLRHPVRTFTFGGRRFGPGDYIAIVPPVLMIGLLTGELTVAHRDLAPGLDLPAGEVGPPAGWPNRPIRQADGSEVERAGTLLRDDRSTIVPPAWATRGDADRLAAFERSAVRTRLARTNLWPDPATGRPTRKLGTLTSLDRAEVRSVLDQLVPLWRERRPAGDAAAGLASREALMRTALGIGAVASPADGVNVTADGTPMAWTDVAGAIPRARWVGQARVWEPLERQASGRTRAAIDRRTADVFAPGREVRERVAVEADLADLGPLVDAPENGTAPGPLAPEERGVGGEGSVGPARAERSGPAPRPASGHLLPSGEKGGRTAPETQSVTWTLDTPREQRLTVTCDRPGVVVTTDRYDPDWRVELRPRGPTEGGAAAPAWTRAPLLRCERLLRGVAVPAGATDVRLTYRPARYVPGAIVSGLSLVVATGLAVTACRGGWCGRRRSARSGRAPAGRS